MSAPTEATTRQELIDPALSKAGWDLNNSDQVGTEIPVDGFDPEAWQRLEARLRRLRQAGLPYEVELPAGICDYALYRPNGKIIAEVEAKRTSVDPRLARAQTEFYVSELARGQSFWPFGFMTNGREIHFWDVGQANPREVQGFFSLVDLENRLFIRQNMTSLAEAQISAQITDRAYQMLAIRQVSEAFEQGKRKALLVMATGTGKTRVAMALVELFLNSNQARRILFVADWEALVEQALTEGFQAQTRFQRRGIRGVDLSEEERNVLIEQGLEPDDLGFSGTDLEVKVSNRDTLRQQWEEIWQICLKDQSGQLPGKTIVFAMTQEHALRLQDVFEEIYPQHPGLAQVITYKSKYRGTLIKKFKKESLPRLAISVDMLETGVNLPEVVNLIFIRPVHSQIKLEQMIGRGTRNHATCRRLEWLPNGRKEKFLIIDFWENNFSKDPQQQPPQSLPVTVTIFNTRLKLLALHLADHRWPEADQMIADLRAQIGQIPLDAYPVSQVWSEIEEAWQDPFWSHIGPDKLRFLQLRVGPLLRYVSGVEVQAATFTSKVERLKLQILSGKDPTATAQSIAEDFSRLPDFVFQDAERREPAQLCLTPRLKTASVAELSRVIETLAEQMKNRRARPNAFLQLDHLMKAKN